MRNLFILSLLVFISCKSAQNISGNGSEQQDTVSGLDNRWVLAIVKGQSVDQLSYSSTPTLEINTAEQRIGGSDGCNNFFGQLEGPDENRLKLTIMGSTKAYCPEIKNSDMLGQYLYAVTTYQIKRDTLIFFDEAGTEILRYQKEQ